MFKIMCLIILLPTLAFSAAGKWQVDVKKANARVTDLKQQISGRQANLDKQQAELKVLEEAKIKYKKNYTKTELLLTKVRLELSEIRYFVFTLADQEASYTATKALLKTVQLFHKIETKKEEVYGNMRKNERELESKFHSVEKIKYENSANEEEI